MSQAYETKAWLKHYAPWTPHELDYGDTTIASLYQDNLERNADKPATYFFGRTMTFAELDKQVRRAAAGLRAFGVRPGDRVALCMPNCPQHIIAFHAVLQLGAAVVEHNPLYTAHELEDPFKDHGARIAICFDKTSSTLEKLRDTTPLETIISVNMINAMPRYMQLALRVPLPPLSKTRESLTGSAPNTVPWETLCSSAIGGDGSDMVFPEVKTDDTAVILYTSGTTGVPKGAQLTHANLYSNVKMGAAWVPGFPHEEERILAALPLFHAYGMTFAATLPFYGGSEMVLLPTPDLKLIMQVMKKHKPTFVPGVPTLYEKILEAAELTGTDISGVASAFSGASTLPISLVERWEQATGGRLVEGYGLTECSPILTGNTMDGNRRPGWIGVPFPDTLIRICDTEDPSRVVPDGEEGEIQAKGPQVFKGYLNKDEATKSSFVDGWYRTGDIGVMDDEGYIKIVSRLKEVIITGGFNVYPVEVEEVLRSHPDIADVAVVGLPRRDGSEIVTAAITLNEGAALDPEGLKEYCRTQLTRYKVPRKFYHFEDMPRDMMGKIRRREVRDQIIERHDLKPAE